MGQSRADGAGDVIPRSVQSMHERQKRRFAPRALLEVGAESRQEPLAGPRQLAPAVHEHDVVAAPHRRHSETRGGRPGGRSTGRASRSAGSTRWFGGQPLTGAGAAVISPSMAWATSADLSR